MKDAWPQILEAVQKAKRSAWMVVFTGHVRELNGDILSLSFPSENDVMSFRQQQSGSQGVSEYLRQAIVQILGIRVKFIAKAEKPSTPTPPQRDAASDRETQPAPLAPINSQATTEWPTVAIPGSAPQTPIAADPVRPAKPVAGPAPAPEDMPSDADAPPEDEAPPEPTQSEAEEPAAAAVEAPVNVKRTTSPAPTRSSSVAFQEPQRYGEAVVRELLGATFIEEQSASGEAR